MPDPYWASPAHVRHRGFGDTLYRGSDRRTTSRNLHGTADLHIAARLHIGAKTRSVH